MKLVNWQNYATESNRQAEINRLPSKTVPGMTLSLQDLLTRYVRGENVATFTPIYAGDDPDFPIHLERMDEMERTDLARNLGGAIEQERDRLTRKQQKRLEEQAQQQQQTAPKEGGTTD